MGRRDRYKWNKNSLINNSVYLRMYIETLRGAFTQQERHLIYMVSKYFTDGVEFARDHLEVSQHCFERGERAVKSLDDRHNPLMFDFIGNIYLRSKSYFFYKGGNVSKAMQLVKSAIENNDRLVESNNFDLLVFDSLSHCYNYALLCRKSGNVEMFDEIVYGLVSFLLTAKTNAIISSDKFISVIKDVSFGSLKYSNIYTLLLQNIMTDIKSISEENDACRSVFGDKFVSEWMREMIVQTDEDRLFKEWLSIYLSICAGEIPTKEYPYNLFAHFLNGLPNEIIAQTIRLQTTIHRNGR